MYEQIRKGFEIYSHYVQDNWEGIKPFEYDKVGEEKGNITNMHLQNRTTNYKIDIQVKEVSKLFHDKNRTIQSNKTADVSNSKSN